MSGRAIWWVSLTLALGWTSHGSAALPEGWSSRDIGTTGGSASEAGGTWIVSGDGGDVWSSADAFHFVYRTLSGNGEITARVVSNGSGSSTWSKGGVMIRETPARDSKHAMMAITGGDGGGLAFQNRPTTGGRSYTAHGNPVAAPPYWVRLTREGNTITAYSSADGVNWVQQPDGTDTYATPNPVEIPMAADVLVGLFVCSGVAGEVRTYTFDHVTVGRPLTALAPQPADGGVQPGTWVDLTWAPGSTAVSHDVYFGTSFVEVRDSTGDTFRGNQPAPHFTVGLPGSPCPDGLEPGTTYYWRVDEVEADGVTRHRGQVWSFLVRTSKAYAPDPRDGAQFVALPVTLTWAAGFGARSHAVYFSDDFDAVANAQGSRPQTLTEYRPSILELSKTYYWRIDELDGQTTHKGDVWSFTTRPAELASAGIYYVDTDHPEAHDTNPGTEARPWKTIGRGTQALEPGDVLLIKAGTYREGVILHKSSTEANPIRIWAYPGDEGKVIINAAEPVTGWQKCTGPGDCAGNLHWGHIYYADVARLVDAHELAGFAVRQVFQHGQLLPRSRFPDAGWRNLTGVVDPGTTFSDSGLVGRNGYVSGYFNGSVCHIKTEQWHPDQIEVADYSYGVITLASSPRAVIEEGFGYYLTNVVGEINAEGEWAYDPSQRRLFLWPKEDTPEDIEITYRRFCLRTYSGTSFNEVRGLTMYHAYESALWLYQAHNMQVEDNTVEHSFNCGIFLQATDGICEDNRILDNTIRYCCSTGIALDGGTRNNRIEGNTIYAIGTEVYGGDLMNGRGEGIRIGGGSARVYHNRVDRTALTSIYLSGEASGREVAYNHLTNACLSLADGGSIYMDGFGSGPETDSIHHNIIEDVFGCWTMNTRVYTGEAPTIEAYAGDSPGIYVDEGANHRLIEHNTVIRSYMAGIYVHWAPDNMIQHNTLYDNRGSQIFFEGDEGAKRLTDNDLFDNIMFSTDAQQRTFFLQITYDDVYFGRSDSNWFYSPYADQHIRVDWYGPYRREDMTLDEWRALSGYDGNSRDFAYLGQFRDIRVDLARQSRIICNPSLEAVAVELGPDTYCDVQGNKVYGDVNLPPFESIILLPADFAVPISSGL